MHAVTTSKRSSNRRHAPGKVQMLTRENLDRRTKAHRAFNQLANGITQDLGGRDRLSTIELALVDAFAGAALHLQNLNARLLLGETIDLTEHATAISSLVRISSRIGTARRPKEVESLRSYLARAHQPPQQQNQDITIDAEVIEG